MDNVRRRLLVIATVGLALLLIATSCASPTATPAPTQAAATAVPTPTVAAGVLKIGNIGPLAGVGSEYGTSGTRGANMAVEDINKAGGITVAGKKYLIQPVTADSGYDVAGGRTTAEKLVFTDQVKFVISIGTGNTQGSQQVTEPNKVLLIYNGGSDALIAPQYAYTFRVTMALDGFMSAMLSWALEKYPQNTRIFSTIYDDASGKSVQGTMQDTIKLFPQYQNLGFDNYTPGTTDFYPWITKMLAMNPQPNILNLTSTTGTLGNFLKQLNERGYTGLVLMPSSAGLASEFKVAGAKATEGILYTREWNWEGDFVTPLQREMSRRYTGQYGVPMTTYVLDGYDAVKAVTAGVVSAGNLDPAAVKDAMPNATWDSVYGGKGKFYEKLGRKCAFYYPIVVGTVKNGEMVNLGIANPGQLK